MTALNITYKQVAQLKPRQTNPRTHSKKQTRQIAASIKQFGFSNPVLIDAEDGIVAGHGRVEAAKLLHMEAVPTICLKDLSEAEIRAYVIVDNKLAENAGWDREILAIELQGLVELDIDVTLTGFDTPEIDILIGNLAADAGDDADEEAPMVLDGPAVTQPGDLWQIGKHRLICGDATDHGVFELLLDGAVAQMVFTDLPFNVPINGHVSGLGKIKHREFQMAVGEMSEEQFTDFLATVFQNLSAHSADGAIHYICIDWRHLEEIISAGRVVYTELKNLCVWAKTNGGMGSLYRSQHEPVFVFKAGTAPHINNVELGKHGRYRTNIWSYPGANSFGRNRDTDLAQHPIVKPLNLAADAILDCSKRGGVILDAFAGSGTTLMAAHKTGRRGYGVELDPLYCDLILRRISAKVKVDPIHIETGKTFTKLERQRTGDDNAKAQPQPCPHSHVCGSTNDE